VWSSQVGHITVAVRATDRPSELGSNELVIVGMKVYDFAAAGEATARAFVPAGVAITVQNGLDTPYELAQVVGRGHVLIGRAALEATVAEPGVIGHLVPMHALTLAELEGPPTHRLEGLADEYQHDGGQLRPRRAGCPSRIA
jgi:2-dehydropantoate 2-reductase